MLHADKLEQILQLHTGIAQRDNARMFELLSEIHPIHVKSFPSRTEWNGWVVPDDWRIKTCEVRLDGELMFDGAAHPLAVGGSSASFSGQLSKAELDQHVVSSSKLPSAYLYNPLNNLRPWQKKWSLSIPYSTYRNWPDGDYDVELITEFSAGEMLVGDCRHSGSSSETVVFTAHTCHPRQLNDGLSGVLVLLALFKWLENQKTNFTYLGVIGPEHLGKVFYLSDLDGEDLRRLKIGIYLDSLGSSTPLAMLRSFKGETLIDDLVESVLTNAVSQVRIWPFRGPFGCDETVWEAPGVEIPMVTVTRRPFAYYHSSEDTIANLSHESLEGALDVCKTIVRALERDFTVEAKFTGLVALSNPKYDLYVERANAVLDKNLSEIDLRWGALQDYLPRYFDGQHSMRQVATEFGVLFEDLRAHVEKWEAVGLVAIKEITSLDDRARLRFARWPGRQRNASPGRIETSSDTWQLVSPGDST